MFFAGYFIRSTTPLLTKPLFPFTIPYIFSRPPPPSFPFIRSLLAAMNNFFRDAFTIIQFFWPLFLVVFCISLFASFVQPYIFAFLSFAFRNCASFLRRILLPLRALIATTISPIIKKLPSDWNPFSKKKQSGGKSRSGGKK
ncbi:hypothetical protein BBK36DRAFT_1098 [Trichoderma citrinoviride]|uniref:Uncharacterized protein n=1 Tax=Trichoderma citrinoviride TaxID=58853 RepID=A0A2T4BJD5_9HYPO|nr:hypothetical protein BBK36DRAFT_1098 [Trichoderma citrinoviride]PTB69434.1 hypothetical protein BBK36DRAFT_1098 [Trichoderma citrinoviride]